MKKVMFFLLLAVVGTYLSGCGETVSGIGKDANRIGKGVKTVFIREEGK